MSINTMNKLYVSIKQAIANKDIESMRHNIEICDSLHRGLNVDDFKADDMPNDETYEELKEAFKNVSIITQTKGKYYKSKEHDLLNEYYMNKTAIIKSSTINKNVFNDEIIVLPKYDGVSCIVKLTFDLDDFMFKITHAETRGEDVGLSHKSTDITDKLHQILNEEDSPWFNETFHEEAAKISTAIVIRGEIVLKHHIDTPSAPYVAGNINSKRLNINEEHLLTFIPFENTRLYDDNNFTIMSQIEFCQLIKTCFDKYSFKVVKLNDDFNHNNDLLMKIYEEWNKSISSPIDGVVYCPLNWRYPLYKEETGVNYNKYAIKPCQQSTTRFVDVEWTIGINGKLYPTIKYEEVIYNKKKYNKAASSVEFLRDAIVNKFLHKGSILNVEFRGGIISHVNDVIYETNTLKDVYCMPTHCPFCNTLLNVENSKTLICLNNACSGIISKRLEIFIKNVGVKKCGPKNIIKAVQQNTHKNVVNIEKTVNDLINDSKTYLNNTTVANLLIGLGLFTKTTISKNTIFNKIKENIVKDERHILLTYFDGIHNDPLVDAIVNLMR